jgi:aspartate-semialdehyde dehydrogenase
MAPSEFRDILRGAPGVVVADEPRSRVYPTPFAAAGQDAVFAGRIRRDLSHPNGIAYWVVGDNLRKGAATNAVQVAELLHERDLVKLPEGAAALA